MQGGGAGDDVRVRAARGCACACVEGDALAKFLANYGFLKLFRRAALLVAQAVPMPPVGADGGRNRQPGLRPGTDHFMRVFKAFFFSLSGMGFAWRDEAAFREVVLLAIVALPAAFLLDFSPVGLALLVLVHLLSLVVELLNTAIEAAVDHTSLAHSTLAKKAKDCGSAAQLITLGGLVVLWGANLSGYL